MVKAYEELASLGYVETNRTRGTFVKAWAVVNPTDRVFEIPANTDGLSELQYYIYA
jgi:DNA-binding transcriptional regulator YhcF (GntR family)